ncbi:MAG: hypothetical protein V3U52_00470 [Thermoplasmata archaeon]
MSGKEGKEEVPEIRRFLDEHVHYHFHGVPLNELVERGLIDAILEANPGIEVKGLLFGKRQRNKWIALTEITSKKWGKSVHIGSLDSEDTKPLKNIVRVVEDVTK